MSDIPNDVMAETSSILPYDFVKQNNIFGIDPYTETYFIFQKFNPKINNTSKV